MVELVQEFDDGTMIEKVRKRSCLRSNKGAAELRGGIFEGTNSAKMRVVTPEGRRFEFWDPRISRTWSRYAPRAIYWATLWNRTGGTKFVVNRGLIPCEVAILGKPAIAAYLTAVQGIAIPEAASQLGVSPGTIEQYRSDFLNERR